MKRRNMWARRLLWVGLSASVVGCGSDGSDGNGKGSDGQGHEPGVDLHTSATGLLRAESCDDLLGKIQSDAIAKLDLTVALVKSRPDWYQGRGGVAVDDGAEGPVANPSEPGGPVPPSAGEGDSAGGASDGDGSSTGGDSKGPTGSSDTNTQVAGVDEADFIKVANGGEHMYLLHGNRLHKLKSWPAAETALEGEGLLIEGAPTEMFVNDAGKAVVFSSVFGYSGSTGVSYPGDYYCTPEYCGGSNFTKVTIADVSGATPKTERELYYEGYYVSSRRYATKDQDVVRVVMQAYPRYANLFVPAISWADAWGRPYDADEIASQLDEWRERTAASIRNTELGDWLPLVQEAEDKKLVTVAPACDSFFMPQPGLSDYGLTHVLTLDVAKPDGAVGGVTIMGAASTVYSNTENLLIAQPDYRAYEYDYGFVDQQQTILHAFSVAGAETKYAGSGAVPGMLAGSIAQFALDEYGGVIRAVTSGWKRTHPEAKENTAEFWETEIVNRLVTAKVEKGAVGVVGQLTPLGKPGESVYSSRFLGDRGYIVTARQTDPLLVIDLKDATKPALLGQLEIPGFSNYLHPLDDTHLLALGANGTGGMQLQIFDVSDASAPKQAFTHDLGDGSSSEAQYNHKALTFFEEKKLLAMPLYGYDGQGAWTSRLALVKVDVAKGFTGLGFIDHSALIQAQTWKSCDAYGNCWEEPCMSWTPEVRRGHFVSSDADTFAYSFSYGGVQVHDVSNLASALTQIALPSPGWDMSSWYGVSGGDSAGGGVKPGTGGAVDVGGDVDTPPVMEPTPDPLPPDEPVVQDAGVAMTP